MVDLSLVDRTDWAALDGAYGPSAEVPEALRVLAEEKDADSDTWSDAMNNVVLGQIWHQGEIYPVTPHALPFLIAIAGEPGVAGRPQIAAAVGLIARAALRYVEKGEDGAPLGRATAEVLAAHATTIAGWLGGELDEQASFIASTTAVL